MDKNYTNERNMLAHTVALLFSFAMMAEAVAFGSRRERRDLLDMMRLAEGAGLRLATGYGCYEGDTSGFGSGYSPDEAMRLAQSLFITARILEYQVWLFDRYTAAKRAWIEGHSLRAIRRLVIAAAPRRSTAKVPLIDTS